MSAKWFVIAALVLLCNKAHAETYACTTNDGHMIAGRELPPECKDRDKHVLNPDASVKEGIPAPLTPEQRKKRVVEEEQQIKKEEEERDRAQRQMPWPPLEKYSSVDDIEAARERDLAPRRMELAQIDRRINQLQLERKNLEDEAEFYEHREKPADLKKRLDANTLLFQRHEKARTYLQSEILSINDRYDALKQRYQELQKMLPPTAPSPRPDMLGPNRPT